jgi:hypothetical protein
VGSRERLTHLLFVNDVLLFCFGSTSELRSFRDLLLLYKKSMGMEFNDAKSSLYTFGLEEGLETTLDRYFPFPLLDFNDGVKYLGFYLKPNNYGKVDWNWLLGKVEKKYITMVQPLAIQRGDLVLIKSILEAIPWYTSILWLTYPKGF